MPSLSYEHLSCEACILGKHCRTVFPKSSTIYEHCFDLIHSDVWTSPCASRDRNKYFVTFIDEKSKYTWVTLLPSKDRVYDAFLNFHSYITNQFNAKIKVVRSDNGGEYTSQRFKDHLAKHEILHQNSCPHTPQQNGVAERKNRHLMDVARSMMFHANVPKRYWGDAVLTACYLINRIPTKILSDLSPFEVLNNIKPSISHLRVFGCVCFVHISGDQRDKLEAKSVKCMFIGYSTTQKGYKCFDPITNRTYVSRDVKFMEELGYHDKKGREDLEELSRSPSNLARSLRFLLDHLGNGAPKGSRQEETQAQEPTIQEPTQAQAEDLPHNHDQENVEMEEEESIRQEEEDVVVEEVVPEAPLVQQPRRSEKLSLKPWVYHNNQAVAHPI